VTTWVERGFFPQALTVSRRYKNAVIASVAQRATNRLDIKIAPGAEDAHLEAKYKAHSMKLYKGASTVIFVDLPKIKARPTAYTKSAYNLNLGKLAVNRALRMITDTPEDAAKITLYTFYICAKAKR
jgi:hypothetical protein